MMTHNHRPGVYSQYDVSSFYTSTTASLHGAVVAKANGGEAGKVYRFTSYPAACEVFGKDSGETSMRGCLKILFSSGVPVVHAVSPAEDYSQGLALLEECEHIGALVCDCSSLEDLQAVRNSVERSAKALYERVAYGGMENPQDAIAAAKVLNSERVCLCCPGVSPVEMEESKAVYAAAAVAGMVLAANDPAKNFSGEVLRTLHSPTKLGEAVIQSLMKAGVTVVEKVGESVQVIRALTTKTMQGGVEDRTMTSLNTILIIDHVIASIRMSLAKRLRGSRISTQSLESVLAQVTVELAAKQDGGMIENFLVPKVYAHESDPSVCVVELSFKVAHVLNQIHVVAHIQV